MPPTQTVHCVPSRSSKLMPGCAGAGCGGPGEAAATGCSGGGGADGCSGSTLGVSGRAYGSAVYGEIGGAGCSGGCGATAAATGAAAGRLSSAPIRCSMLARRAFSPTVLTSATIATTGNASSTQPSKKKKPSIIRPPASRRRSNAIATPQAREGPSRPYAEPQTGCAAFRQYLAAETKQRRGSAAGCGGHVAGRFEERSGLDQPAEVLLVQAPSGDRFHSTLESGQRELSLHQLEYHRAIFQLSAQPRDRGRQDAPMIES